MKKILIIDSFLHIKNKIGLSQILNYLQNQGQIIYHTGNINDIPQYDIIYSSSTVINTSHYPNQKFIFGPHFSTFPNHQQLQSLQNHIYRNSIYIHPSEWAAQTWINMQVEQLIKVKSFPFPVHTEKFAPNPAIKEEKINVLVYYKHRNPIELKQIKDFLTKQKIINYRVFDYKQRYNEDDYLSYMQQCKYGIILDAHESQGFAIEEALSCNVPLLVWNVQTMNQEINSKYQPIPCTSIPYWNEQCGEYFHHHEELERKFQIFQMKLEAQQYYPRQYILDNLSTEKCAERFMELI